MTTHAVKALMGARAGAVVTVELPNGRSRTVRLVAVETPPQATGDAEVVLASESGTLELLVVGSRGYGPLRAVLLGSVSSALVRSAQAPLVVVPRSAGDDLAGAGHL